MRKYLKNIGGGIAFAVSLSSIHAAAPLPALKAKGNNVSVSGFSSGGFMAVQMHMAYSSIIKGVGVIEGGPYYCSEGNAATMFDRCLQPKNGDAVPHLSSLITFTQALAKGGKIDPIEHVKDAKIFIFSGSEDKLVFPSILKKVEEYYQNFTEKKNIKGVYDIPAGHAISTQNYGKPCAVTSPPFLNNCAYDVAGAILNHMYGELDSPSVAPPTGKLMAFDQSVFIENRGLPQNSLADTGYVYIPKACETEKCAIHIFFHGCTQYAGAVGKEVVENAGFNGWADTNKLIILYPQTTSWSSPDKDAESQRRTKNPFGCWDWWGYSQKDFYSKDAPQIKTVMKMVQQLTQ